VATASKRLTRKQIRQPDWFQVTSEKALEFYEENQIKVLLGAAGIVVLLVAVWGWQVFKQRQDTAAAQEFTRAMSLYQSEKYQEAISDFKKVQAYRWSHYSALAHLYEANSHLAINEFDKAIATADRFIAATSPNSLYRQMGLLSLASAAERKNECQRAAESYSEAAKIKAALRARAILGKARCSEQLGDTKSAVAAYKEYLNDNPDSVLAVRLTELDAAAQAAAK
jgi:predicted negative regulator of RcsB-dependent stress response